MNLQALFDGLLAATAFYTALGPARSAPALRLGCLLLGSAAVLGTLRFSGVLALPQLHQYFSMLGAGVGLPMLAIALTQPGSAVASQRRYAWIFAVIAAVVCTLVVMVVQWKLWTSLCAIVAALSILGYGAVHKQLLTASVGLLMLVTLIAFAAKAQAGGLLPGDILHIGLTATLVLIGRLAFASSATEKGAEQGA
jgi:hypothetical protein